MSCVCDGECCSGSGWTVSLAVDIRTRSRASATGSRGMDSEPWWETNRTARLYSPDLQSCAPHVPHSTPARPTSAPASPSLPYPCILCRTRAHLSYPRRTQSHVRNTRFAHRSVQQGEKRRTYKKGLGQRTEFSAYMPNCTHAFVASISLPCCTIETTSRADCRLTK